MAGFSIKERDIWNYLLSLLLNYLLSLRFRCENTELIYVSKGLDGYQSVPLEGFQVGMLDLFVFYIDFFNC